MADHEPRGEEVEIEVTHQPFYGTKDPRRDVGKITGRDDPGKGGKR